MPIGWPPTPLPPVPPFEAWGWDALVALGESLKQRGWTTRNPTAQERNQIFDLIRCDLGHTATGRYVVAPDGTEYPMAACSTGHGRENRRAVFTCWPPYYQDTYLA